MFHRKCRKSLCLMLWINFMCYFCIPRLYCCFRTTSSCGVMDYKIEISLLLKLSTIQCYFVISQWATDLLSLIDVHIDMWIFSSWRQQPHAHTSTVANPAMVCYAVIRGAFIIVCWWLVLGLIFSDMISDNSIFGWSTCEYTLPVLIA